AVAQQGMLTNNGIFTIQSGGSLDDQGTVLDFEQLTAIGSITVEAKAMLIVNMGGTLTASGMIMVQDMGTLAINCGAMPEASSTVTVASGGMLQNDGTTIIELTGSLDDQGTVVDTHQLTANGMVRVGGDLTVNDGAMFDASNMVTVSTNGALHINGIL